MEYLKYKNLKETSFAVLMVLLCAASYQWAADSSLKLLIDGGSTIAQKGFPQIDPFLYKEGTESALIYWLTDILFYRLHTTVGQAGIMIAGFLVLVCNGIILYRLCDIVSSGNRTMTKIIVLLGCVLMGMLSKTGVQTFSGTLFLLGFLAAERYILYKKRIYLLFLMALSVVLMNLNAAVWPLFILLLVPYVTDGVKWKNFTDGYGVLPFGVTIAACFYLGIFNPYSTKSMFYFLRLLGKGGDGISNIVPIDFLSGVGILVFGLLLVWGALLHKGAKIPVRYLLMGAITLYLGMVSSTNLFLFCIATAVAAASALKNDYFLQYLLSNIRSRIISKSNSENEYIGKSDGLE